MNRQLPNILGRSLPDGIQPTKVLYADRMLIEKRLHDFLLYSQESLP